MFVKSFMICSYCFGAQRLVDIHLRTTFNTLSIGIAFVGIDSWVARFIMYGLYFVKVA